MLAKRKDRPEGELKSDLDLPGHGGDSPSKKVLRPEVTMDGPPSGSVQSSGSLALVPAVGSAPSDETAISVVDDLLSIKKVSQQSSQQQQHQLSPMSTLKRCDPQYLDTPEARKRAFYARSNTIARNVADLMKVTGCQALLVLHCPDTNFVREYGSDDYLSFWQSEECQELKARVGKGHMPPVKVKTPTLQDHLRSHVSDLVKRAAKDNNTIYRYNQQPTPPRWPAEIEFVYPNKLKQSDLEIVLQHMCPNGGDHSACHSKLENPSKVPAITLHEHGGKPLRTGPGRAQQMKRIPQNTLDAVVATAVSSAMLAASAGADQRMATAMVAEATAKVASAPWAVSRYIGDGKSVPAAGGGSAATAGPPPMHPPHPSAAAAASSASASSSIGGGGGGGGGGSSASQAGPSTQSVVSSLGGGGGGGQSTGVGPSAGGLSSVAPLVAPMRSVPTRTSVPSTVMPSPGLPGSTSSPSHPFPGNRGPLTASTNPSTSLSGTEPWLKPHSSMVLLSSTDDAPKRHHQPLSLGTHPLSHTHAQPPLALNARAGASGVEAMRLPSRPGVDVVKMGGGEGVRLAPPLPSSAPVPPPQQQQHHHPAHPHHQQHNHQHQQHQQHQPQQPPQQQSDPTLHLSVPHVTQ